jgi:FkbM family methyltransferase
VKTLVQSLLRPFGLRLSRLQTDRLPDFGSTVLFNTLRRFGFSPRLIFDVGANHGNWTRSSLSYFPAAEYVLIEPQDYLKTYVQDLIDSGKKIRWVGSGAADKSGTMRFYISDRDDSSTFLPRERQPLTRVASETGSEVKTLDDIRVAYDLPIPDMVKIDAEGLDLKVVKGASSLVCKTDVFLLEAGAICPIENSVGQVARTMDELGYRLLDIMELNRSPKYGVPRLTELAFLRKSSSLLANVTSYE